MSEYTCSHVIMVELEVNAEHKPPGLTLCPQLLQAIEQTGGFRGMGRGCAVGPIVALSREYGEGRAARLPKD